MKYGLLKTSSINIGDEIQCLAASRFLPQIDYLIHRERTDKFKSDEPVRLIMNHWWLHCEKHFPPSEDIDPLFVSFHLKYTLRNKKFLSEKVKNYLKKHEPIGCRDSGTADFFNENDIKAYFSGCLTTTLLPNEKLKHKYIDNYVLCVDVPPEIVNIIKQRTSKQVISFSRHLRGGGEHSRFKWAKFALFLYHNAFCVITPALHVALPATAFGTPVCVLNLNTEEFSSRFDTLGSCFHMITPSDFMKSTCWYDISHPPSNPDTYSEISKNLVAICSKFTGFDSHSSVFEDSYNPIWDLCETLIDNEAESRDVIYYLSRRNLVIPFFKRMICGKNRHDL